MTLISNHLMISFFTTFCVGGFNILRYSILGLWYTMSWILWEQILGGIPIISAIVHPVALFKFFNTHTKILLVSHLNLPPWKPIVSHLCLRIRTYNFGGRALNSIFGASSMDCLAGGDSWFLMSNPTLSVLNDKKISPIQPLIPHNLRYSHSRSTS